MPHLDVESKVNKLTETENILSLTVVQTGGGENGWMQSKGTNFQKKLLRGGFKVVNK